MVGIWSRFVEALASPLSMFVLVMALLGVTATILWASRGRGNNTLTTTAKSVPQKTAPPKIEAPQIMRPASAEGLKVNGGSLIQAVFSFALLAVAMVIGVQFVLNGGSRQAADEASALREERAVLAQSEPLGAPTAEATLQQQVSLSLAAACEEGPVSDNSRHMGRSYQICADDQSAIFDLVGFAPQNRTAGVEATEISDLIWQDEDLPVLGTVGGRGYEVENFSLSRDYFDIVPASGVSLEDYDVFIALGMAGFDADSVVADQRAANRGFHIGRYVLDELRGEDIAADCDSSTVVYALSVGQYRGGAMVGAAENLDAAPEIASSFETAIANEFKNPVPVLLGVRYKEQLEPVPANETPTQRRLREDRQHRALIEDFMQSRAASLPAFNLQNFDAPKQLFVERVCSRDALQRP